MNEDTIKLYTAEAREAFIKALGSKEVGELVEQTKAANDSGSFTGLVISTEHQDRQGEIVKQNGIDTSMYMKNPVVLNSHNYYGIENIVGMATKVYPGIVDGVNATLADGKWAPTESGQMARKLYEAGFNRACSIGFIPKEFDEQNPSVITKSEMLEFSMVPVPANGYAAQMRRLGITTEALVAKGFDVLGVAKGYVPKDVSDKKAPQDTPWSKPTLADFTDKAWGDLTPAEVTHIAGHFAYSENKPAKTFGDLKLPHHRASDGAVVFKGVVAAMAALNGGRGGVDVGNEKEAVYNHLAAHYKQFDETPPELKSVLEGTAEIKADEPQEGDPCTMDDGTEGEMHMDSESGMMVCMPKDDDTGGKSIFNEAEEKELDTLVEKLTGAEYKTEGELTGFATLAFNKDAAELLLKAIKAGREISARNRELINKALEHHKELGAALGKLQDAAGSPDGDSGEEPDPNDPNEGNEPGEGKGQDATKNRSITSGPDAAPEDIRSLHAGREVLVIAKDALEAGIVRYNERIKAGYEQKRVAGGS